MQTAETLATAPALHDHSTGTGVEMFPGLCLGGFTMRFERDEEIFGEQEEADFAYKIVSGAARTFRVLSDGRRQVVGFHLPGDVFGLERGETHRFSAEAVSGCVVALVRRTAIERAARADGEAARWLWGLAAGELERLQDHAMLLGRKTATERVASFLLDMAERSPFAGGVQLLMSRADIADYLGLTVETVSRTLTQLERDHMIAIPSSRRIVLSRPEALAGCDA
ncbi:helix-turn-helix domain-containing protein [Phenylobacterium montanum]|uniref:Helix-turn-helix domain-containing protein n=1 Tax=Phenylobacterium montanum TaxID=2823693 RepID=A0A975IVN7_9CAUL|nr:helix-turn-helix domain-containing protein [Caulobacter sp. S6]QUD87526.1 helix-turn-helix domain-containing protein [Caulobacter sp. S6]